MKKLVLFIVFQSGFVFPSVARAEEVLFANIHSVPVQIQYVDGRPIGTGIYCLQSNKQFVATASHCVFDVTNTDRSALLNPEVVITSLITNDGTRLTNRLYLNLKQLQQDGRIKRHASHDVAVIYWADEEPSQNSFNCVKGASFLQSGQMLDCTPEVYTLFTNVPDGSETLILGYPSELLKPAKQWLQSLLESQVDFEYPLYRKGIISQKNNLTGKLIIDSGVYGGNSGGPVFILQHPSVAVTTFRLIGIITEFVPSETRTVPQFGVTNSILVNSGYGVVEPIDYVIELMNTF